VHITTPSLTTLSAFQKRHIERTPGLSSFIKRTIVATQSLALQRDSKPPFAFLSHTSSPVIISNAWQSGLSPRCPAAVPLGLMPFVKLGARGAYYNGCGAENGLKVPDLRFEECCNNHDLCYGSYHPPNTTSVER
jgi:hypothetical protein